MSQEAFERNQEMIADCQTAIKNYYSSHRFVNKCTLVADEYLDGFFNLQVTVIFNDDVLEFTTFGESQDQVGFLEALAEHIQQGRYEESAQKHNRMIMSMINLTSPRLIVKDALKTSGRPLASEILLIEFIFPGAFNHMASMTKTPSSLNSVSDLVLSNLSMHSRSGRFDELDSIKVSQKFDDSLLFQAKCVSVALEYLGLMSPEHLKFGKQDSVAIVWSLGVLLYRISFKDQHPFLQLEDPLASSIRNFEQRIGQRTAGLISQTRRNILLIRYKKADEKDIKGHKTQQLFD